MYELNKRKQKSFKTCCKYILKKHVKRRMVGLFLNKVKILIRHLDVTLVTYQMYIRGKPAYIEICTVPDIMKNLNAHTVVSDVHSLPVRVRVHSTSKFFNTAGTLKIGC